MRMKPSKTYRISGAAIRSLEDFYSEISNKFHLPKHFGRNLDALWDVLTTDVEGPIELIWEDSMKTRQWMGNDFEKVKTLLQEVEKERGDFRVTFK